MVGTSMLDISLRRQTNKHLKYYKNIFSLIRNCINIIVNTIQLERAQTKESEAKFRLISGENECLHAKSEMYEALCYYIQKRKRFRLAINNIIICCLRFLMLYKNLKFRGSDSLNPILISMLGLLSQFLSLIKYIFEKEKPATIKIHDADNMSHTTLDRDETKARSFVKTYSSVFGVVDVGGQHRDILVHEECQTPHAGGGKKLARRESSIKNLKLYTKTNKSANNQFCKYNQRSSVKFERSNTSQLNSVSGNSRNSEKSINRLKDLKLNDKIDEHGETFEETDNDYYDTRGNMVYNLSPTFKDSGKTDSTPILFESESKMNNLKPRLSCKIEDRESKRSSSRKKPKENDLNEEDDEEIIFKF